MSAFDQEFAREQAAQEAEAAQQAANTRVQCEEVPLTIHNIPEEMADGLKAALFRLFLANKSFFESAVNQVGSEVVGGLLGQVLFRKYQDEGFTLNVPVAPPISHTATPTTSVPATTSATPAGHTTIPATIVVPTTAAVSTPSKAAPPTSGSRVQKLNTTPKVMSPDPAMANWNAYLKSQASPVVITPSPATRTVDRINTEEAPDFGVSDVRVTRSQTAGKRVLSDSGEVGKINKRVKR